MNSSSDSVTILGIYLETGTTGISIDSSCYWTLIGNMRPSNVATPILNNSTTTIVLKAGEIVQQAWQAPSLLNSWANYGIGHNPAGYFKDTLGIVHLRGLVKDGTVGQAIFTLPTGYRPSYTEDIIVLCYNGADYVLGYLYITTAGSMILQPCDGDGKYQYKGGIDSGTLSVRRIGYFS